MIDESQQHHWTGRVAAVCLLALTLAGCTAGASDPGNPPSNDAAMRTASHSPRPSARQLAAFVKSFREQYPSLAATRTAGALADDAENICFDVQQGVSRAVMLKRITARFDHDTIALTNDTAADILSWVQREACPAG
jgi:hypothetical protein